MRITIVLADRSGGAATRGTAERVQEAVTRVAPAAVVRPTHPDTASPDLQAYLEVDVDPADSQRVLTDLQAVPGVDGAYVKPPDAAP
jgi:hypothetical protein